MSFTRITKFILLAVLLLPFEVFADTGFFQDVGLDFHGYFWARRFSVYQNDADNNAGMGGINYMTQELRLYPELKLNENITLYMDAMLFSNFMGVDDGTILTYDVSDKTGNMILKRIYGKIKTSFGIFEIGQMPSHWGLGMLSNDGDHELDFGDTEFGDTYGRVLFATKPLGEDNSLTVAVYYDNIVEGTETPFLSGTANVGDNDNDVGEFGLAATYNPMKYLETGFYFVYRFQQKTDTTIYIPDLYISFNKDIWHVDFEGAYISGKTNSVPILHADLTIDYPTISIEQFGALLVAGAKVKPLDDVSIKIGYASGDDSLPNSLNDSKLQAFSFNKNYKVGLIMFDVVDRYLTQEFTNNYINSLNSPISQGNGTVADAINFKAKENSQSSQLAQLEGTIAAFGPSNGSIRNAFFINPVIKYKPIDDMLLKLGVLGAWANKRVRTRELVNKGLLPDNAFDDSYGLGVNYGWEVDLGASYSFTENAVIGLQAGYFFPGNVYVKRNGSKADNVFTIIPRFTINF